MESAQARVQNAATSMYEELDRTVLRKMQISEIKKRISSNTNTIGLSTEKWSTCLSDSVPELPLIFTLFHGLRDQGLVYVVNSVTQKLEEGDMFKCGAKCCENTSGSVEEVQRCIERCAEPLTKCQTHIQNEMQQFQDRLQRGALDCQDKAKDQMGPNSTDAEISKAKAFMEKCVVDCAENHIKMLPNMLKKMKDSITKGVYS